MLASKQVMAWTSAPAKMSDREFTTGKHMVWTRIRRSPVEIQHQATSYCFSITMETKSINSIALQKEHVYNLVFSLKSVPSHPFMAHVYKHGIRVPNGTSLYSALIFIL
jgi:hypothetical protein